MRIGQFILMVNTTKDTVRHYEELGLLTPQQSGIYKDYTDKDLQDYGAIKELQNFGLLLSDIMLIFDLKRNFGCGSQELLDGIRIQLANVLNQIAVEEEKLRLRREGLRTVLQEMDLALEVSG